MVFIVNISGNVVLIGSGGVAYIYICIYIYTHYTHDIYIYSWTNMIHELTIQKKTHLSLLSVSPQQVEPTLFNWDVSRDIPKSSTQSVRTSGSIEMPPLIHQKLDLVPRKRKALPRTLTVYFDGINQH